MDASRAVAGRLPSWTRAPALFAGTAALGAFGALASYELSPAALPAALAALAAISLGIWRLEIGIAILILINPFTENITTGGVSSNPIVAFLAMWIILLLVTAAARELVDGRPLRRPPMLAAAVLFFIAAIVAVPVADQTIPPGKFLAFYSGVPVYLLVAMFIDSWQKLRWVLGAILAAGLIISVHAIWQYATGHFSQVGFIGPSGSVQLRIESTFPHPNQLAGFIGIVVPVAIGLASAARGWSRTACIAVATLALAATVLTFSRGAAVAALVLPFVYRPVRRAWPLLLVAAAALVLLAPSIWQERITAIGNTSNPEIRTRLDLWSSAEQTFVDHPLVGTGLDSFSQAYLAQERPERTYLGGDAPIQAPDTAHNLYLNTLAEQGIVGAAALALVIFALARLIMLLRRGVLARTRAIGLTLLGTAVVVFVHNLFDVTLIPKTSILLWALFGAAAAAFELDRLDAST